jgi:hypothetical protein
MSLHWMLNIVWANSAIQETNGLSIFLEPVIKSQFILRSCFDLECFWHILRRNGNMTVERRIG